MGICVLDQKLDSFGIFSLSLPFMHHRHRPFLVEFMEIGGKLKKWSIPMFFGQGEALNIDENNIQRKILKTWNYVFKLVFGIWLEIGDLTFIFIKWVARVACLCYVPFAFESCNLQNDIKTQSVWYLINWLVMYNVFFYEWLCIMWYQYIMFPA